MECPGVTVAADSEEAKVVEEANKRYNALLTLKQAADNYTDAETQTLDLLKKNREVQSAVMRTSSTACQATVWDITDTYKALNGAGATEGEEAGAGHAGLPSISLLASAVGRGGNYASAGAGVSGATRSRGHNSNSNSRRTTMTNGNELIRVESSSASVAGGASANGGLPEGVPLDSAPEEESRPNPLHRLRGLLESLELMDAALTQNAYLPKLLQYRGIQQVVQHTPITPLDPSKTMERDMTGTKSLNSGAVRSPSRAASRVVSRQHSETSIGESVRSRVPGGTGRGDAMSTAGGLNHVMSMGGGGGPGSVGSQAPSQVPQAGPSDRGAPPSIGQPHQAPSLAESAWPDELLQDLADLGPDGVPRIELLWEWQCPLTNGAHVSCMAWNRKQSDLLAVGYGNNSFDGGVDHAVSIKGTVAFWSLKNPEFPLWSFETKSGVTALDFATYNPNILVVGLYDGTVAIYDIKARQGIPAMESDAATGRHTDPVWKVRWLDRGHERDEPLISISTDGRVTQWSIAKGLEFVDLMKLKRVPRRNQGGEGVSAAAVSSGGKAVATAAAADHDAFISRLTSGMTFDFSARDEQIYIAGTEDGWIHKCSTSYSEQYLESYQGHMGPVYNIQWSPFRKDMFISASGDWTLRLWQEGRESALLLFQAASHEINDVQWCPTNATVFGDVTSGGRLELWDFELSTVKPVVTHKAGMRLSCLLFSTNSPVVVCGGENGAISVFRTHNIEREYDTLDEQLSRLDETIRANVMKQQPGQMHAA
ncbi:hypothetical protein CEUSTIGMA_g3088.t1 [Chlamydomonas eustigma]|uniref:Dynein axonemal intermediate chain 4 n=1 Tax=Chlamydomonas eustigma TaxID=1157962 RepID=A0A250WXT0_9CHLO|nr:hypothetical protein CEUSTIGMA_g3088.t1 [Chlamydomonas eustigma]|eukprot:GAX75644.1 hypothetical protein CEUSTIGMA_g3088.t1 [Chlamydomonas eustigma]